MPQGYLAPLIALFALSSAASARADPLDHSAQSSDIATELSRELARTKFVLNSTVMFTQTPIRIDSVDLTVPEESALASLVSDLDASIGEEIDLQSTTFQVSLSYFPLPFLQVFVNGGYVTSQTDADIAVSGTLEDNILGLEGFEVVVPQDVESDGFSYGGGGAVLFPIMKIADRPLIMRASAEIGVNSLENIETETLIANFSIANAQRIVDRDVTLALGVSYIQLDREVEYTTEFGGVETGVRLSQSLDSPWTASSTLLVPITDSFGVSVSAANNFDGLRSYGLSLSFRR